MAQFYVSCPLNYEENMIHEIKSFWFEMMDLDGLPTREALPEFLVEPGGVSLNCPEHLGYQMNFFCKIAHRILIRIHKFPARFYDQYEKEMKQLPLTTWISKGAVSLKIETAKSRINHERNLIESSTRALATLGYKVSEKAPETQQLYIRIFRDQAIISLDTSGEHLHRRGYAVFKGEAPLRENLAAILSQQIFSNMSNLSKVILVDPFVGSGTTLFETASFQIPNFKRAYSWQKFLNKPKIFGSETWVKNYRWLGPAQEMQMIGIDSDEKAISNLHKNKDLFLQTYPTAQISLKTIISDSRDLKKSEFPDEANYWIISNPPYGIRLVQDAVNEVFINLEKIVRLSGAIILHPESMKIYFNDLRLSSEIDFANQGLNIKMSLFKR